jgi:hypothetical protein
MRDTLGAAIAQRVQGKGKATGSATTGEPELGTSATSKPSTKQANPRKPVVGSPASSLNSLFGDEEEVEVVPSPKTAPGAAIKKPTFTNHRERAANPRIMLMDDLTEGVGPVGNLTKQRITSAAFGPQGARKTNPFANMSFKKTAGTAAAQGPPLVQPPANDSEEIPSTADVEMRDVMQDVDVDLPLDFGTPPLSARSPPPTAAAVPE